MKIRAAECNYLLVIRFTEKAVILETIQRKENSLFAFFGLAIKLATRTAVTT